MLSEKELTKLIEKQYGLGVQKKSDKPECQKCFDEEGSYGCIRPAHKAERELLAFKKQIEEAVKNASNDLPKYTPPLFPNRTPCPYCGRGNRLYGISDITCQIT